MGRSTNKRILAAAGLAVALSVTAPPDCSAQMVEYLPGIKWPEPEVVTPGDENRQPPSDALVLFDGSSLDAWKNDSWKVADGVLTVGSGPLVSKQTFGDCQLHIEWSAPTPASGQGQGRGNSGVFFSGGEGVSYEVQVLDSFNNKTYFDGQAGSLYKQMPPMVNAMRPPGEWNTYEILWTAPRFGEGGELESPAYVTVIHNGVLIQNYLELRGSTYWHKPPEYVPHGKLHISLQDHGNPVRFRNIWVREWQPIVGTQSKPPSYFDHATGKAVETDDNAGG